MLSCKFASIIRCVLLLQTGGNTMLIFRMNMYNKAAMYGVFILFALFISMRSHAQADKSAAPELLATTPVKPDSNNIKALIDYAETKETSNRNEAIQLYLRAATLAESIDYYFGAAKGMNYAGILYSDAGRYDEAAELYKKAIALYTKVAYNTGMASANMNLGNVHRFRGENREALDYYLKASALLEATADSGRLTILYNNIGGLFSTLKNSSKAIAYSAKALRIAEKKGLDRNIIDACINLSKAYSVGKDTASAIQTLLKGFPIAEKTKDFKTLNYLHNNLGVIYMHQHKMKEAKDHFSKALGYSYKQGNPYDVAHTYFSLAVFYRTAKVWKDAETFANKTLKVSDSLQLHELTAKTYNVLSDIEEERGNYKKAYEYYIAFTAYNDSVNSKEQLQLMHNLEAKYQSTSKDKALSEKQLQIERSHTAIRQKNNLLFIAACGLIILALFALLFYFYNRSKQRLAVQQLKALERERELKILQAMMEGEERERARIAGQLHDGIGGMVSAIKMHLGVSKLEHREIGGSEAYQQAVMLLEDMAKEVRKTAHTLMPELLHKYRLEEAIRMHCHSMSNKNLDVHFQSYDVTDLTGNAELVIYRMVQELLNNAVKHAAPSQILVDLSQDKKTIAVTVEDNGKGFIPPERTGFGMGLSNIENKVAALDGRLEITSEPGTGTSVTIELPLQNLELV